MINIRLISIDIREVTKGMPQSRSTDLQEGKRKFQGVPQSQKKVREKPRECHNHETEALPRPQEEEETDKSKGVVGWCEGAVYLASLGRPTDIGLQLGKACYPCSG